MNTQKELFISFGRSSVYGLRKWESEKENIKGGTMTSLTEEYLLKEDNPKHISEILQYILPYRPHTNEYSLLTNLKNKANTKFCFYNSCFVGLKSKKYPLNATKFKRLNGPHFSWMEFRK